MPRGPGGGREGGRKGGRGDWYVGRRAGEREGGREGGRDAPPRPELFPCVASMTKPPVSLMHFPSGVKVQE